MINESSGEISAIENEQKRREKQHLDSRGATNGESSARKTACGVPKAKEQPEAQYAENGDEDQNEQPESHQT